MGASETRPKAVREQVAKVFRAAQKIAGGREALARQLGVEPGLLAEWIAMQSDAPDDLVHKAVGIILDDREERS